MRWHVLTDLIHEHGWTRAAELGVFRGDTFLYLLEHCPDLELIGVDAWEPLDYGPKDMSTGAADYRKWPLAEYERQVRAEAARYGERAVIIKATTLAASRRVEDGSQDLVFVDATHTTDAVLADIAAWAPKLKPTGWLTGHDAQWPSVRRAIDEAVPGYALHADNVWTIPKARTRYA